MHQQRTRRNVPCAHAFITALAAVSWLQAVSVAARLHVSWQGKAVSWPQGTRNSQQDDSATGKGEQIRSQRQQADYVAVSNATMNNPTINRLTDRQYSCDKNSALTQQVLPAKGISFMPNFIAHRRLARNWRPLFVMCCLTVLMAPMFAAVPTPEPAKLSNWQPLQAGEHPRLLFRAADVPAMKQRAATPAGQAMIARLKHLLGGGEAMPTVFNDNEPVNKGPKGPRELPVGAFTAAHAAGFGLLFQVTGEQRYADLARECLDKVFAGQVDRDERYSWTHPGTGFRVSGMLQAVALAYDLNYTGWPADYRQDVLNKIQNIQAKTIGKGKQYTLQTVAAGGGYPPGSNHFGAYVGGAIAALAILGDPGADDAKLKKVIATAHKATQQLLTSGFGDYGWFAEGSGSDRTAMQPGMLGFFQAQKLCLGLD